MKNGVLIIAVGNPYYGNMAFNLAATLKAASPDTKICVVADDHGLRHLHPLCKEIFDVIKKVEFAGGLEAAMELRMQLPKLSPFETTISLDADTAWLGKPVADLFAIVSDEHPITFVNEGYFDLDAGTSHATDGYLPWAEPSQIAAAYHLTGKLYQMRGELIVFRKTKAVADAFKDARKIRKHPLIEPHKLAGSVTEEFALNIAFNKLNLSAHTSPWPATYWPLMNGGMVPEIRELKQHYYALSVGGNFFNPAIKKAYDVLVAAACNKLGLPNFYPLKAKQQIIPERLYK